MFLNIKNMKMGQMGGEIHFGFLANLPAGK